MLMMIIIMRDNNNVYIFMCVYLVIILNMGGWVCVNVNYECVPQIKNDD